MTEPATWTLNVLRLNGWKMEATNALGCLLTSLPYCVLMGRALAGSRRSGSVCRRRRGGHGHGSPQDSAAQALFYGRCRCCQREAGIACGAGHQVCNIPHTIRSEAFLFHLIPASANNSRFCRSRFPVPRSR